MAKSKSPNRHIEPSLEPPPPPDAPFPEKPEMESASGGGGELTETEAYLLDEGFGDVSARRFRDVDLVAAKRDIKLCAYFGCELHELLTLVETK